MPEPQPQGLPPVFVAAVVAPIDELGRKLRERFAGVVDRVMLNLPAGLSEDAADAVLAAARAE